MILKNAKRKRTKDYEIIEETESLLDFHHKIGHPGPRMTIQLAEKQGHNVKRSTYKEDIDLLRACEHCNAGKMTNARKGKFKNQKEREEHREQEPGKSLHIDMVVIVVKSKYRRYKYVVLMTDEATDYTWAIFLRKKSEYSRKVIAVLKSIKKRNKIEKIRTDNELDTKLRKLMQKIMK